MIKQIIAAIVQPHMPVLHQADYFSGNRKKEKTEKLARLGLLLYLCAADTSYRQHSNH